MERNHSVFCLITWYICDDMKSNLTKTAKPFLKWAGGKTQLINDIQKSLPKDFTEREVTFIEPFVGSGAVMFWMLNNFPNIKKAVINDINAL